MENILKSAKEKHKLHLSCNSVQCEIHESLIHDESLIHLCDFFFFFCRGKVTHKELKIMCSVFNYDNFIFSSFLINLAFLFFLQRKILKMSKNIALIAPFKVYNPF